MKIKARSLCHRVLRDGPTTISLRRSWERGIANDAGRVNSFFEFFLLLVTEFARWMD
jgi:hypothetical protein